MAKSKLRLDTRRALKDGTYPVQIAVGYGTNLYLSTGVFLLPTEWDDLTRKAVGKSARRINQTLDNLLLRTANRVLELRENGTWNTLTRGQLRQMLLNPELESPTVDVPSLGDLFERVIATKTGKFYSIKIEPEAKVILDKYRGKKHLLSPFDSYSDYRGYMSHLNKALAKIGPIKMQHGKKQYTANHLPLMAPLEASM